MVNRLAVESATASLPPFMASAVEQIAYNGYEPDRWREEDDSPVDVGTAPEHFLDLELWGDLMTLPSDRYAFMKSLQEKRVDLRTVGYLPYAIVEEYGRLKNAFRQWRTASRPADREAARANAVLYAGILGHFVADGSQPMHMTVHFNGWSNDYPNPRNFTKDRTLHSRYESRFVDVAIDESRVKAMVQRATRSPDVFGAVKTYLAQTFAEIIPMYELEKSGEFNPDSPRTKGVDFVSAEIARSATMLSTLWYTAWLESGEPIPQNSRE